MRTLIGPLYSKKLNRIQTEETSVRQRARRRHWRFATSYRLYIHIKATELLIYETVGE